MASFEITKFQLATDKPKETLRLSEISALLEQCQNKTCTGALKYKKEDGSQVNLLFVAQTHNREVFLQAASGSGPLYDLEQQGRKLFMKDQ